MYLFELPVLAIAVLEESSADEPLEEHNDLCTDEILVTLFLIKLEELVLKDFVEIAAFTTWSGKVVVWLRAG